MGTENKERDPITELGRTCGYGVGTNQGLNPESEEILQFRKGAAVALKTFKYLGARGSLKIKLKKGYQQGLAEAESHLKRLAEIKKAYPASAE